MELWNPSGSSPLLLTCEHAGRSIPAKLNNLGVSDTVMQRHIAYDIGAEQLARQLSVSLDATLILQPYSRLVIDCNRPFEADDCIPVISDGIAIPANAGLSSVERQTRLGEVHRPFHDAISERLSSRWCKALISVHSFTPELSTDPAPRPWHLGLLHGEDTRIATQMMKYLKQTAPELNVAYNEPYRIEAASDYTIPVHGERDGLGSLLLEIRNDLIDTAEGRAHYCDLLSDVIGDVLETL